MDDLLQKIKEGLIYCEPAKVEENVRLALEKGMDYHVILEEGLIAGMDVVGFKFREGEIYLPEVLIAASAMHKGLGILAPFMTKSNASAKGRILLGTVRGDLHDIGKNIVGMMFQGAGFEVIDLGIDVPPEKFVAACREYKPDVLGLSALLTSTMLNMKETVEAVKTQNDSGLKIIVGGAPLTAEFAEGIGADGYAPDAFSAVEKVREWLAEG